MTSKMTPRERVFATLDFHRTDRIPCDLTDGRIWPELYDYFLKEHGLKDQDAIYDFLDTDLRWIEPVCIGQGSAAAAPSDKTIADDNPANNKIISNENPANNKIIADDNPANNKIIADDNPAKDKIIVYDSSHGPLFSAVTVEDVDRLHPVTVPEFDFIDFKAFREKWPDHAIVLQSFAKPYFWDSCAQFGSTEVFYKINEYPEVYEALLQKMELESNAILISFLEAAKDDIDIVQIWDDFAGQNGMMVNPVWWREVLKPYYKREIDLIHSYGRKVFFHSCGAVKPILGDMIEIGVDTMTVFQVNAKDMDPKSIADEFGGKICFYGGIDVQQLLSFGTRDEVQAQVRHNIECFSKCGGYIIANCHSHISTIKGDNIVAMARADRSNAI